MANAPDMKEAIEDTYSDCAKQARREAADFGEGLKPDANDVALLDSWKEWAKTRTNTEAYVATRTLQLLHMSQHKLRVIQGPVGCLSCDTEVLTEGGWTRIDRWNGEKIMQADVWSGTTWFVDPDHYFRAPCTDKMLKITDGNGCSMVVTKNHRIPFSFGWPSGKSGRGVMEALEFAESGLGTFKPVRIPTPGGKGHELVDAAIEEVDAPDGMQYCFTVPTSFFVARHNGFVFITGNSGKSHGCEMDIVMRCATQAPCADGHIRNRCLMARGTYQELKQTTFDMWMSLFPSTQIALSSPIHGRLEMHLGNRKSIIDLLGFGMDMQSVESKLRSNDFSIAFANECQYIDYPVIEIIFERLGRYPRSKMAPAGVKSNGYFKNLGLTCDTNAPVEGSWLYERAQVIKSPDELFLFQPPAMFRTWNATAKRWEYEENRGQRYESHGIPRAENIENLNEGWDYYWQRVRTGGEDYIRRNVLNQYGHVLSGTPVYPEFRKDRHVLETGVGMPPSGSRLFCGMDLGRTPRAVFGYYAQNGGVRIPLILAKDCGVQMFAETVMRPALAARGISPRMVTVFPDPAGENKGEQVEATSVEILRAAGFDVAMPVLKNNDPFTRMETVRQALTRSALDGDPYLLLDPTAEELIRALAGGYTYAVIRQGGGQSRTSDRPDKGPYSHVANALEYLLVGLKYGRREDTVFGGMPASGGLYAERFTAASQSHDRGMFC